MTPEEWAEFTLEKGLGLCGTDRGDQGYVEEPRKVLLEAIALSVRAAVAEEREACAREATTNRLSWEIAAAIRARS